MPPPPYINPTDDELSALLSSSRTIAVVGLSDKPDRPSYGVAAYLRAAGYRIIPVNPHLTEWQGERAYPTVSAIPERVDIVDIFRRSEFVPEAVADAIASGAHTVWMQLGVINEIAAHRAHEAGLTVVMDRCMAVEHRRLLTTKS